MAQICCAKRISLASANGQIGHHKFQVYFENTTLYIFVNIWTYITIAHRTNWFSCELRRACARETRVSCPPNMESPFGIENVKIFSGPNQDLTLKEAVTNHLKRDSLALIQDIADVADNPQGGNDGHLAREAALKECSGDASGKDGVETGEVPPPPPGITWGENDAKKQLEMKDVEPSAEVPAGGARRSFSDAELVSTDVAVVEVTVVDEGHCDGASSPRPLDLLPVATTEVGTSVAADAAEAGLDGTARVPGCKTIMSHPTVMRTPRGATMTLARPPGGSGRGLVVLAAPGPAVAATVRGTPLDAVCAPPPLAPPPTVPAVTVTPGALRAKIGGGGGGAVPVPGAQSPPRVPKTRAQVETLMARMGFGPYPQPRNAAPPAARPRRASSPGLLPSGPSPPESSPSLAGSFDGGGHVRFARRRSVRDFATPPATKAKLRTSYLFGEQLVSSLAVLRNAAEADRAAVQAGASGSGGRRKRVKKPPKIKTDDDTLNAPLEGYVKLWAARKVKSNPKFRFNEDDI